MSGAVSLPARIDLPAAMRLVVQLREVGGPVVVDGSAVTHLGALGLQALVAASRDANKRGDTFELTNGSEKMVEHMAIMGVSPEQLVEGKL